MNVGVKVLACRVDGSDVLALEVFHKFIVNQVNTLLEAVQIATLVDGSQSALQVIDHGQQLSHGALSTILDQVGFLLERALPEVFKVGHQEEVFLLLVFELCFKFSNLLLRGDGCFLGFLLLSLLASALLVEDFLLSGLGLVVLILLVLF